MKISSKIKRLIIIAFVLAIVAAGAIVIKNIILGEVREQIRAQLGYSRMYLSAFPPALIIEDARSVSTNPFYFARKITVKISAAALLSQNKPFNIIVEDPVVRFYPPPEAEKSTAAIRAAEAKGRLGRARAVR